MKLKNILKIIASLVILLMLVTFSANIFAAGNCAFSAGKGYGDADMSSATISAANVYATMGYNSYYSTEGATREILAGQFSNGTKRLESDIVFLTGHGTSSTVSTTSTGGVRIGTSTESKWVGTEDVNWSNVRIAIFLACETGANDAESLAYDVFKKSGWTTITMGWRNSIGQTSAKSWISNFNNKLSTGATVETSLNYANSQSYTDSNVKDISFYGEPSSVFKQQSVSIMSNNSSDENMGLDESNITYISGQDFYYDGTDNTTINLINAIKTINNTFDVDNYEVNVYELNADQEYYTIDFTFKNGDYITNSGYTVIVKDGFVKQIADNTINSEVQLMQTMNEDNEVNDIMINTAKEYARNEILNVNTVSNTAEEDEEIEIREQTTRLYEDLENNKKYIQVLTIFGYEGNDEKDCIEYMYEI